MDKNMSRDDHIDAASYLHAAKKAMKPSWLELIWLITQLVFWICFLIIVALIPFAIVAGATTGIVVFAYGGMEVFTASGTGPVIGRIVIGLGCLVGALWSAKCFILGVMRIR